MMDTKKPKILYFDIETSPILAYTWSTGRDITINPSQVKEHKKVICISYNWSNESIKKVGRLTWNKKTQCDKKMLSDFNKIANKADLILGHNGKNFDVKELRTAMALRGLKEAWCETPCLDTLQDYRRAFRMPSNRLDALGRQLGLGKKNPTDFQLWIDVVNGDLKALERMGKYCDQDVRLLRQVHERLAAYVPQTQAVLNLKNTDFSGRPRSCKGCENKDVRLWVKFGRYKYKGQDYQKYICKICDTVCMPDKDKGG